MSTSMLDGYPSTEKTAYITAIASIATADNSASDQEINYLSSLADQAGLDSEGKQLVSSAAKDTSGQYLKEALNQLKTSELRFSLLADLMAFAESDSNLAPEEKNHIETVASYLGIDGKQVEALNDYVKQVAAEPAEANNFFGGNRVGNGLLESLGIEDKLKGAGINMGSLAKGLISFVGPMIMGNMISKGLNKTGGSSLAGGGGLDSLLSGITGGKGLSGVGGFLTNLLK